MHTLWRYLWAAPNTLLGLAAGVLMLALGGRVRVVFGVIEFYGGLGVRCLSTLPVPIKIGAITLGHVILGECADTVCCLRAHEHIHVRQYEIWGAFFLPAYFASSLAAALRGQCAYRGNHFERQAYARDAQASTRAGSG